MLTSLEDNVENCSPYEKRRRMLEAAKNASLGDRVRSAFSTLSDGVMVAALGLADASRCIEPFVQNAAQPVVLLARPKRNCTSCSNNNTNGSNGADDNANANNNQNTINIVLPPLASLYGAGAMPSGTMPNGQQQGQNGYPQGNYPQSGTVPLSPQSFQVPVPPFTGNGFGNPAPAPQQNAGQEVQPQREPIIVEKEKVVPVYVPQIKEVIKNRYLRAVHDGKTKYIKEIRTDYVPVNRPTVSPVFDAESINRPTVRAEFDQESINRTSVAPIFDSERINRPTVSAAYDTESVVRPTNTPKLFSWL